MENVKKELRNYSKANIDLNLKKAYVEACKDKSFSSLINSLGIKDEIAYKYTMKLETTYEEMKNCEACPALSMCKNNVRGYVLYPKVLENTLEFNYRPCKYMEESLAVDKKNKSKYFDMPAAIRSSRMKDIDISDKKRLPIIKFLKKFYDEYPSNRNLKGLYLSGSFGSGKTFLISALLNELAEKDYNVIIVYFPEFLLSLKNFNDNYQSKINALKKCDILLLDDIGAEQVSSWSRDEVLGTILQYRMDNNLSTFFTSNYSLLELEIKLSSSKGKDEAVSARRVIERIKQLTEKLELTSENKRS